MTGDHETTPAASEAGSNKIPLPPPAAEVIPTAQELPVLDESIVAPMYMSVMATEGKTEDSVVKGTLEPDTGVQAPNYIELSNEEPESKE